MFYGEHVVCCQKCLFETYRLALFSFIIITRKIKNNYKKKKTEYVKHLWHDMETYFSVSSWVIIVHLDIFYKLETKIMKNGITM